MTNKVRYLKFLISGQERSITGRLGRIRHLERLGHWDDFERTVKRQLHAGRGLLEMKALQNCSKENK